MYQGSEAYSLDVAERTRPQRSTRPSLEVVEGRGLDAQARSGVSPKTVARLKAFAVVLFAVVALAVCRVGLYAASAGVLSETTTMRSELKEAKATQDDLRVERSVLSSTSRISRIAKSYGMVAEGSAEQMDASAADEAAAAAAGESADAAQDASADSDSAAQDASGDTSADSAAQDASAADAASASAAATSQPADISSAEQTPGDGSTAGSNAVTMDALA